MRQQALLGCGARADLNDPVEAKSNERNASGKNAHGERDNALDDIVGERRAVEHQATSHFVARERQQVRSEECYVP